MKDIKLIILQNQIVILSTLQMFLADYKVHTQDADRAFAIEELLATQRTVVKDALETNEIFIRDVTSNTESHDSGYMPDNAILAKYVNTILKEG